MQFLNANPLRLNENEIMNYFTQLLFDGSVSDNKSLLSFDMEKYKRIQKEAELHKLKNPGAYKTKMSGSDYSLKAFTLEHYIEARSQLTMLYEVEYFVYLIYQKIMKYCPIESGELRRSIKIDSYFGKSNSWTIYSDCEYAAAQHEIFSYRHDYPTSAKFFERAVYEIVSEYGSLYNIGINIKGEEGIYLIINGSSDNLVKGFMSGYIYPTQNVKLAGLNTDLWNKDSSTRNNRFNTFGGD